MGRDFLGYRVNQCGALYLALEDSPQRLKDRMDKVLGGGIAPANCRYATAAPPIDSGLIEHLDSYLDANPDTRIIVIDTLQRIRGASGARAHNAYANDYAELALLKSFADKRGICLLLVHHLRKMADDADPFNRISGTNAIMGASDTILVMTRDKRSDSQTTLSITGRDIEETEIVLEFDKTAFRWRVLGDASLIAEQQARTNYNENPLVRTVRKLLEKSPEWRGTAKELMLAGQYIAKTYIASSVQKLGKEIQAIERPLFDYDRIVHTRAKNGSGGGVHRFYRQTVSGESEYPDDDGLPLLNTNVGIVDNVGGTVLHINEHQRTPT